MSSSKPIPGDELPLHEAIERAARALDAAAVPSRIDLHRMVTIDGRVLWVRVRFTLEGDKCR